MQYDILGYVVAAVIAAGGIYGYFKAGSIPSLIAGLAFGALLAYGAYLNSQTPPKPAVQLVILIILAAMMFFRWYKSGNIMPPGVIALIATATLVINAIVYYQDLRNQF